jgi:hypothetical protein
VVRRLRSNSGRNLSLGHVRLLPRCVSGSSARRPAITLRLAYRMIAVVEYLDPLFEA